MVGKATYPKSEKVYLIKSTQGIYKGQFYNRKPHGFGELYSPTKEANTPNSGLETVTRGNTVANNDVNRMVEQNATYSRNPNLLNQMSFIKYVGKFENGLRSGYGRAIYPDGSVYMGEWKNNLPHGKGRLQSLTQNNQKEFYDGDWVAGQMQGRGRQEWKDGTCYEGSFNTGRKHGKGIFTWPDGNKYEGEYKEDLRDGFGTFWW